MKTAYNWERHHARRVTEMNEEAKAREELMKVVRSPVVRPELKARALKAILNLEFELAIKALAS
jgi:hypothetical protein